MPKIHDVSRSLYKRWPSSRSAGWLCRGLRRLGAVGGVGKTHVLATHFTRRLFRPESLTTLLGMTDATCGSSNLSPCNQSRRRLCPRDRTPKEGTTSRRQRGRKRAGCARRLLSTLLSRPIHFVCCVPFREKRKRSHPLPPKSLPPRPFPEPASCAGSPLPPAGRNKGDECCHLPSPIYNCRNG